MYTEMSFSCTKKEVNSLIKEVLPACVMCSSIKKAIESTNESVDGG